MHLRIPMLLALLLASTAAAEPGLAELGITAGAGVSGDVPRRPDDRRVPAYSTSGYVAFELDEELDLELSYSTRMRKGRGAAHTLGLTGRAFPTRDLDLEVSLFVSPLGRRDEDSYCLPLGSRLRCVDAVERRGYFSPALGAGLTTDLGRDVEGRLEASAEATFYQLDYRMTSGRAAGSTLSLPLQELRFELEASVRLLDRIRLEAHGTYGFLSETEERDAERPARLPPTELPLAPTRYEVGPRLSVDITRGLRAELSGDFGPYIEPCLGRSALGSFRLTARPGPVRIFGQVTYQRDVSPTDPATLGRCDQDEPFPDYESTSARVGFSLDF